MILRWFRLPLSLLVSFLFYIITTTTTTTIIIIIIIIKTPDNITAIPIYELCSTGYSEITIKGLNNKWATFLLEILLLMDVTSISVGNFNVLFPQNLTK